MAPRYELAVGMKRGHKTTKIERVGKVSGKELSAKSEKLRQARTKGVSNVKYIIKQLLYFMRISIFPAVFVQQLLLKLFSSIPVHVMVHGSICFSTSC